MRLSSAQYDLYRRTNPRPDALCSPGCATCGGGVSPGWRQPEVAASGRNQGAFPLQRSPLFDVLARGMTLTNWAPVAIYDGSIALHASR